MQHKNQGSYGVMDNRTFSLFQSREIVHLHVIRRGICKKESKFINPCIDQSIDQSINRISNQSINRSNKYQSISQSINRISNQSINQSNVAIHLEKDLRNLRLKILTWHDCGGHGRRSGWARHFWLRALLRQHIPRSRVSFKQRLRKLIILRLFRHRLRFHHRHRRFHLLFPSCSARGRAEHPRQCFTLRFGQGRKRICRLLRPVETASRVLPTVLDIHLIVGCRCWAGTRWGNRRVGCRGTWSGIGSYFFRFQHVPATASGCLRCVGGCLGGVAFFALDGNRGPFAVQFSHCCFGGAAERWKRVAAVGWSRCREERWRSSSNLESKIINQSINQPMGCIVNQAIKLVIKLSQTNSHCHNLANDCHMKKKSWKNCITFLGALADAFLGSLSGTATLAAPFIQLVDVELGPGLPEPPPPPLRLGNSFSVNLGGAYFIIGLGADGSAPTAPPSSRRWLAALLLTAPPVGCPANSATPTKKERYFNPRILCQNNLKQSITRTNLTKSIKQIINQTINQSINQSINHFL